MIYNWSSFQHILNEWFEAHKDISFVWIPSKYQDDKIIFTVNAHKFIDGTEMEIGEVRLDVSKMHVKETVAGMKITFS
ncbi:hypothetical protein [Ammoniphilus sp. YIM 78166]|uniref:hypothetical protein n=1 Tax=Ammoniphilus sp. YIM 78166 TaxID=1644106 RepID=UPI00106F68C1|nr:hypothetical protein [Ammoniphilus sp. YIM 78166]